MAERRRQQSEDKHQAQRVRKIAISLTIGTLRNIVIVGGVSFWSEYHFVASPKYRVSYPGIVQDFQHTLALLRALPCDVFLGAHGSYFGMLTKLRRYPQDGPRVFIDPSGYQHFVAAAQRTFEQELSKQQNAAAIRDRRTEP